MEERSRAGASGTQHGAGVSAARSEGRALQSGHGWSHPRQIGGTDQRNPDLGVAGTGPGGAASGPPDPVHRRAGPSLPRRSPRLTKSAVQGLRSLPLTTKGGRRTAHSRSVSGDERGQGPSRSSLSSSDHGRSSRGRRSQSREPTPPQLRNFDVGDFTVVSHTTDDQAGDGGPSPGSLRHPS